ncbi:MarR family transcriptional regulator [Halostagnicola bangensis]
MSIDINRFNESSSEELEEISNPELVLRFLWENRDQAWKAKKIARRTEITENSIHPVLSRLEDRGLVRHKGAYWAITDDSERLRQAYDVHRSNQLFNDLYGEEDRDKWIEASEQANE